MSIREFGFSQMSNRKETEELRVAGRAQRVGDKKKLQRVLRESSYCANRWPQGLPQHGAAPWMGVAARERTWMEGLGLSCPDKVTMQRASQ